MRHLFQPLVLTASVVTLLATAQPVLAQGDKYCLQGRQWGYPAIASFPLIVSAWQQLREPRRAAALIRYTPTHGRRDVNLLGETTCQAGRRMAEAAPAS